MPSSRRVLLVNTNTYKSPPVMPIGLEYVAGSLKKGGHCVRLLDLCFSEDPRTDLADAIRSFGPDAVCLSIRNVDTVLWPDPEYFLPKVRELVGLIRDESDAAIVIGGSSLMADAESIRNYLGADLAIVGPGESTLPDILKKDKMPMGVLRGRHRPECIARSTENINAEAYAEGGAVWGFETHKGCSSGCVYCMEAGARVSYREPSEVVAELGALASRGAGHFHLCDPEFNEDHDYCVNFLERLVDASLNIKWALYMKPANLSKKLFKLLGESGVYLVTLTVDTFDKCPEYWKDVERAVYLSRKAGIRLAVDLLTGFPGEDKNTLRETVDFFRRLQPDDVVINTHLRLYRNLKITGIIEKDPSLSKFVSGQVEVEGIRYLAPVFYCHVPDKALRSLLDGDARFRVAGDEAVVNYQKA